MFPQPKKEFLKQIGNGYFPLKYFNIDLRYLVKFNQYEGFRTGLVGAIGGFFGVIFGIWAGSHNMEQAGIWISQVGNFDNSALANILGFIAIFMAINIAVSIIVSIII